MGDSEFFGVLLGEGMILGEFGVVLEVLEDEEYSEFERLIFFGGK